MIKIYWRGLNLRGLIPGIKKVPRNGLQQSRSKCVFYTMAFTYTIKYKLNSNNKLNSF